MAAFHSTPVVFSVPAQPPLVSPKTTPRPPSITPPRTPFSAVTPLRFLLVSRIQIHITLETIYEEEAAEEFIETSYTSSASFLSKNRTCFLEVPKLWPSCRGNCPCA
ncbi:hypothetical protein Acr_06g0007520 [Actinidia rufa]|uniref:Uncharacterized protein n=1 Tax=Actinidia rufa TaxID=165716 RepID=A0A7J0ER51_9ERIC|nr:hypothetical protein Acr_06g0007520 [Actinidia rufa]